MRAKYVRRRDDDLYIPFILEVPPVRIERGDVVVIDGTEWRVAQVAWTPKATEFDISVELVPVYMWGVTP